MNCKNCGSPLTTEDQFCKNCGASVNQVNQVNAQPTQNQGVVNNPVGTNAIGQSVVSPNLNSNPTPVVNNSMPQQNQQPNKPSKKSNVGLIAGVSALIIVVALAAIFIVPKVLNKKGTSTDGNTTPSGNNNGTGVVTPTTSTSSYKVNFEGFTLSIPDNMMYEEADGELLIGDEDETWVVEFLIGDGNYNQLKNNKGQLQSYFQQNGFTAKPAEVKSLGGTEFITIEMAKDGVNFVGAYAKLNSMKVAWAVAYNQDNTYDSNILSKIAPIISSATYSDTSNSIAANPNIKFNKDEISKFAQ